MILSYMTFEQKRGSGIELTKLTVIHDGSETYISEYVTMSTGAWNYTYTADISGSDLRLGNFSLISAI